MSLQVWLPLNGDLHNQGLSNITMASNNVTIDDNGKIGKCYGFTSSSTSKAYSNETINFNSNIISISCWANINSSSNSGYICGISASSSAIFMLYYNPSDTLLRCYSNAANRGTVNVSAYLNSWHHYAAVSVGNKIIIYIDGQEKTTINYTSPTFGECFVYLGCRRNGSDGSGLYYFTGLLNDVRIYNHALSPKEVEEIAKGLVLHYKLDKNLSILDNCYSNPTFNTSTSTGGWSHWGSSGHAGTYGQNTDKTYIFNQSNTYSHWIANGSSATQPYLLHQSPSFSGGFRSIQAIIKEQNGQPITNAICYPAWNARNGGVALYSWTEIIALGNGFYLCKCEGVSQDGSNDVIGIYVTAGNKIYISEMYCENNKELCSDIFAQNNLNTIYDSSGYSNDGTIVGSLTAAASSPRYDVATQFTATNYIKNTDFIYNDGAWSISLWYFFTSAPSGYQSLICLSKGNGSDSNKKMAIIPNTSYIWFKCESTSTTLSSVKVNTWTHLVLTSSGKIYENGIEKLSITPGTILTGCDDLVIGARASAANATSVTVPLTGRISDVRIYATALTADQIKELYNTSMSIDSNGNIYSRELVEL